VHVNVEQLLTMWATVPACLLHRQPLQLAPGCTVSKFSETHLMAAKVHAASSSFFAPAGGLPSRRAHLCRAMALDHPAAASYAGGLVHTPGFVAAARGAFKRLA
jgi:hypothetical protein